MQRYSDATLSKVRQVDLLSYLQQRDPGNLVKAGYDTYTTREHDSLKISNGQWFWFSRRFGGISALDYLVKVVELSHVVKDGNYVLPSVIDLGRNVLHIQILLVSVADYHYVLINKFLFIKGIHKIEVKCGRSLQVDVVL